MVFYRPTLPSAGAAPAAESGSLMGTAKGLGPAGLALQVAGIAMSTVGAYYGALSQRYQLRSQASSLDFEGSMADINAQVAERNAAALAEAGAAQKALTTLQYGQAKSASRTRTAAAGIQAGVGSAAEVQASIEAAKDIDALVITRNTVRAVGAARTQAVNYRNQGLLARTSARNLRRFAKSISPEFAAFNSLIGGAGQVSADYLNRQGRY